MESRDEPSCPAQVGTDIVVGNLNRMLWVGASSRGAFTACT